VFRYLFNRFIRPIFTINNTPHAIALGVWLGVFIGFTPTVGLQLILVAIIGTMIKANRIIALILCWISNPITFIPLYYGYYWFGAKLVNVPPSEVWTFGNFADKIDLFKENIDRIGYLDSFELLGDEIFTPMIWGSLVIALCLSVPLYPITLTMIRRRRNNKGDLDLIPEQPDEKIDIGELSQISQISSTETENDVTDKIDDSDAPEVRKSTISVSTNKVSPSTGED